MSNKKTAITLLLAAVFALSCLSVCFVGFGVAHAEGRTVEFYAINDFHGAWQKLAQMSGYLASKKSDGNTVLLNSGDMFQGSMESNSNYGKLFAECMDIAGFDSFTYGNHEFDWGVDNLVQLASNSETPFLGANIYHWDRETGWGDFADELAQEYVVRTLDNGVKVGIIGVIGSDQITSISSQLVQDIGFKDPLPIIKQLAEELRTQQSCDVVVASVHAGPSDIARSQGDTPIDSNGLNEYVDAVFCAHTHYVDDYVLDGIPFIQGGSSGNFTSHVTLSVSDNGTVSCVTHENLSYSPTWTVDEGVKAAVQAKIDASNATIADEANQVLATLDSGLDKGTQIPRLVAHAIAQYAVSQGYDIHLAMVNNARDKLSAGPVTYTDLYEAIPFDNVVYVAMASGKDIIKEAGYSSNSIWRVNGVSIQNSDDKYYLIAVIDYLLYHQSSSRNYNYFPSAFRSGFEPVPLTKEGVAVYNYRLITRDFLLSTPQLDLSNYIDSNIHTNANKLVDPVSLPTTNVAPTRSGLAAWQIALIVVAALLVIAAVIVVVIVVTSRRKKANANK